MNPTFPPAGPAPAPCMSVAAGFPPSDRGVTLTLLLAEVPEGLTWSEILNRWPADQRRPSEITVYRWLTRAVRLGSVTRLGAGQRGRPFVYRLARDGRE